MEKFIQFLEAQLKKANQDYEFTQTQEQKILLTVSIRITEAYLEEAKKYLEQDLTK